MSSKIEQAENLIKKGEVVLSTHTPNPPNVIGFPTLDDGVFAEWRTQSLAFLTNLLGSGNVYVNNFTEKVEDPYRSHAEAGIGILRAVAEDLRAGYVATDDSPSIKNPIMILSQVCERFHLVVRQLRSRYDSRETLNVQDEYDVQDLLHALLWLDFDDIRPEEWTPSYAGKTSRMDFLLKSEQIVVEVKKTRTTLGAKEVGSQLIEDIARYEHHPDCKALVCFVYDPEGYVANPRGVEHDLSRDQPLPVRVYIRPR